MRAPHTLASLLLFAAAAAPAPALAQGAPAAPDKQKAAQAQALFDEALNLMKQSRYAEACPKLAQSQDLDPGMGTEYRLAECYELAGRLAAAWSLYRHVADEARAARRSDREAQALRHAEALALKVPHLTLTLSPSLAGTSGLEILRDGEPVDRAQWSDLPTDPGNHTFIARAPGRASWEKKLNVAEGARLTLAIPDLATVAAPPPVAVDRGPAPAPQPDRAGGGLSKLQIGAIAAGGVGVLGLALGIGFGVKANRKWDETLTHCQGGALDRCDPTGVQLGGQASSAASVSTAGFIVGGAAVAAGTVLFVLSRRAPKAAAPALLVLPTAGAAGAGLTAVGSF
ncbi:MAG: hypothetical protein QM820_30445 [Minicystis sp.]